MAAIRTQIYLTPELRARLDDLVRCEQKSMAQIVREALVATFGSMPNLAIPSRDEWERG